MLFKYLRCTYDCPNRYPGYHSGPECDKYREYRKRYKPASRESENEYVSYVLEAQTRMKRGKR